MQEKDILRIMDLLKNNDVQQTDIENALKGLNENQKSKLNEVLQNSQKLNELLNSEVAKEILRKRKGGNG